jgi:hypothetical protein
MVVFLNDTLYYLLLLLDHCLIQTCSLLGLRLIMSLPLLASTNVRKGKTETALSTKL